ncbi:hypothetical protein BASA81_002379 [Batrachochytrium salamandrivorans]|nr:hypothetical protein BASA81_002379 [Batrachochytrium salamandrivorans]
MLTKSTPNRRMVGGLVALWFVVCNLFNISSKTLSNSHALPSAFWNAYLTTTAQLAFTSLMGLGVLSWQHSPGKLLTKFREPLRRTVVPGVALAMANLAMHWALTRTSVGMFQTAKSASPFFTAFACHFLLHRRYTTNTYLSLLPIVIGLGFASVTDLEFEPWGTLACFFSAMCQVCVNLLLKSVLETCLVDAATATPSEPKRQLFAYELQGLVCLCGLFTLVALGLTAALFSSPLPVAVIGAEDKGGKWTHAIRNSFNEFLLLNVALYASESVLAYAVNARLSRLPYAVVDAVRRLSIVLVSNFFFHFHRELDANRSLNLLAVLAVATGAVIFAFVVQEENAPRHAAASV